MKRVYLLRHAKSDWATPVSGDHDRPLAPRGLQAARLVGRALGGIGQAPDRIVSSSAVRALRTAELAKEAGGWDATIEASPDLYDSSSDELLALVRCLPDDARSVLLVGHEPVWSETAGRLVGGAAIRMVTAAVARIDFEVEQWRDLEFGRGRLAWLVTPKVLGADAEEVGLTAEDSVNRSG